MQNTEQMALRSRNEEQLCAQSLIAARRAEEDQALMSREAREFLDEWDLQLAVTRTEMEANEEALQRQQQVAQHPIPSPCADMISDYAFQLPARRGHHRTIPHWVQSEYEQHRRAEAKNSPVREKIRRLRIEPLMKTSIGEALSDQ